MTSHDELRDERLLLEVAQITHDYGALHRRTVRDLARTRAELAQANRVLETVAHDMRTPLSSVLGFTELLLDDDELTPEQRDLSERVNRAARTLATLTDELVESVTLGASPLRSNPVDLVELVRRMITRHQLLSPPRGIRIVFEREATSDAQVTLPGDEPKLERLLDNLISNAVKFSPDSGHVRVSITADDRNAEIRVRDEGPGLPPDQLSAIFLPFHRAPGASAVPGIGLGLTIVKQIAGRHGGRVHVESVLGDGATFVVQLPVI